MTRLVGIDVEGLLGRFDHSIAIDRSWEFVILHGPNGVGKTRLLEICQAALNGDIATLRRLPFDRAFLRFDDGHMLAAISNVGQQQLMPTAQDGDPKPRVVLQLYRHGELLAHWGSELEGGSAQERRHYRQRLADTVDAYIPAARTGATTWREPASGQRLTLDDVVTLYADALPDELLTEVASVPEVATQFLSQQQVHLISTQRLLTLNKARPTGYVIDSFSNQRLVQEPETQDTVVQLAAELADKIASALAQNSRISQQQDKTFPLRLLGEERPDTSEEEVRDRYRDQAQLRRELADIGVLDQTPELPLPLERLEDWQIRVMSIYLQDSHVKLANFDSLLRKITLLREVVNARFLYKTMRINAERGFYFETDLGLELAPAQLSSGEQHEVVLLYRLLFQVPSNALVLIDEPEISLHIAWQQEVLNDLKRIAEISDLQFVVATHSPHIVHDWVERMVELSGESASK